MSERKAVIKNADMSEEMQQDAVDCATQALEKYNIEKVCIVYSRGENFVIINICFIRCFWRSLAYTNMLKVANSRPKSIHNLIWPTSPQFFWSLQDIAAYIKKEFDKKYNPTWHCIVGRNFGSYVTHETRHFIYFYLGQVAILLFKSG